MNHLVDSYIRSVLTNVRYKKIHPNLAKELYDHIECKKEDMMDLAGDLTEEDAYQKAVDSMGNPTQLGKQLHQLHKPHIDIVTLILIATVISFSLVLMKVVGNRVSIRNQVICIIAGMIGFVFMYFIDYQKLRKFGFIFIAGSIALLVAVEVYGRTINGMKRWLHFGMFSMNIIAISVPLFLIGFVSVVSTKYAKKRSNLVKIAVLSIGMVLCCWFTLKSFFLEGILLVLSLYFTFLFYLFRRKQEKHRKLWIGLVSFSGLFILAGMILKISTEAYRIERVQTWVNTMEQPELYIPGGILQIIKNAEWIGDAGVRSMTELDINLYGYYGSDYTFAAILGFLGIFAAILVGIVFSGIIFRAFQLTKRQKDEYGSTLMASISFLFALQVIVGIMTHINGLPWTGMSIPFLSYQGTTIALELTLLGFFLGIHRRKDILPNELISCKD